MRAYCAVFACWGLGLVASVVLAVCDLWQFDAFWILLLLFVFLHVCIAFRNMPLTYLVFDAVLLLDFVGIVVERLLLSTTRERICDTGKKILARFRIDGLGWKNRNSHECILSWLALVLMRQFTLTRAWTLTRKQRTDSRSLKATHRCTDICRSAFATVCRM